MGILSASCSFTRFKITEPVPKELWMEIPAKLRQFAFQDIDDIAEERGWGWTSFEDMLDMQWRSAPPEKGAYLAFALRLDTRRIPPAVLKKYVTIALREEEGRIKEQGKKFIARDRKNELRDQVKLRLMGRFLPIPAVFDVAWATDTNIVYLASTQTKLIELFMNHFTLTFDLHLEPMTPYALAASMLELWPVWMILNPPALYKRPTMNEPYLGQTTDMVLGQEFLTWLWFRSETQPMGFKDKEGVPFSMNLEQRIVVQGGEGDSLETASVSGSLSQLREVRLGLRTGKKVTRALVRFEREELAWQTTIKAEDFSLGSFKTPKVEREEDDDPDAAFLEKMYLMELCLGLFDACYKQFLDIRLSSLWDKEVQDMSAWMSQQA